MDSEEIFQKYYPLIKSNLIPFGLGLIGFVLLSVGLVLSFNTKSKEDIAFQPAQQNQASESKAKILVDVSGAVIKPGVYPLKEDSRIQDALIMASGLSGDADRDWVSKNINLAQKVSDGYKIYIPKIGQASTQGNTAVSLLININSATASELDSLSGVGPATAQKIIDNRPYSKIEELVSKKVLTTKVFDKLKDKISVY